VKEICVSEGNSRANSWGLVALEPFLVDTWQNTHESACHVWTRPPDQASLIPDDATRRVVIKWLQGLQDYGEQGGQKRDEKAVVPQARTKECGRKDITETSTD